MRASDEKCCACMRAGSFLQRVLCCSKASRGIRLCDTFKRACPQARSYPRPWLVLPACKRLGRSTMASEQSAPAVSSVIDLLQLVEKLKVRCTHKCVTYRSQRLVAHAS